MIKNVLLRKPVLVVFDVTKRCNSRCTMCNIWRKQSKLRDELKLSEINEIFSDLKSSRVRHVFLQGGEPLLRRDILEIIKLSISAGLTPSLITNGLLLNKKLAVKIAGLKCNVSISLDTLKRGRYKLIRGVDRLDLVLRNIKACSKIRGKNGVWDINSTISRVNYDEVTDLFNFAVKYGFKHFACPYNYSICNVSARSSKLAFDKEVSNVIKAFKKLYSLSRDNGLIINCLYYDEIIKFLRGDYEKPCDALKYSVMINEKGELAPCLELKPFISLKSNKFRDAVKNFDYSIIRKCYESTPCFYGCTRGSGIVVNNFHKVLLHVLRHPKKFKELKHLF